MEHANNSTHSTCVTRMLYLLKQQTVFMLLNYARRQIPAALLRRNDLQHR
jgi:hypothetical protein